MMTQLFGYFSSEASPMHLPGAAFLCAAILSGLSLLLFTRALRQTSGAVSRNADGVSRP